MKYFTASYSKDLAALRVARQLCKGCLETKFTTLDSPKAGSSSITNTRMPKSDTFHPAKVMVCIWAIQQSQAHYTANLEHSWSHHKLWFLHAKPNDRVKAVLGHHFLSLNLSHYRDSLGTTQAKEKDMWRFLSAWRIVSGQQFCKHLPTFKESLSLLQWVIWRVLMVSQGAFNFESLKTEKKKEKHMHTQAKMCPSFY